MDDGNDKYEKDETLTVIRARKCESEEDWTQGEALAYKMNRNLILTPNDLYLEDRSIIKDENMTKTTVHIRVFIIILIMLFALIF